MNTPNRFGLDGQYVLLDTNNRHVTVSETANVIYEDLSVIYKDCTASFMTLSRCTTSATVRSGRGTRSNKREHKGHKGHIFPLIECSGEINKAAICMLEPLCHP